MPNFLPDPTDSHFSKEADAWVRDTANKLGEFFGQQVHHSGSAFGASSYIPFGLKQIRVSRHLNGDMQGQSSYHVRIQKDAAELVKEVAARNQAQAKELEAQRATELPLQFSRAAPTAGAGVWQSPEPTKFDQWTYLLQDKQIDTKRVLNAIKSTGQQVDDAQDVYLQETLYHGRTAKRVKDFAEQEERPLMELMRDKGLSLRQVEEYLHARHAPEANKALAERNPSAEVIAANLKAAQAAGDEGCVRLLRRQSLFTIRLHDYSCI